MVEMRGRMCQNNSEAGLDEFKLVVLAGLGDAVQQFLEFLLRDMLFSA